MLKWLTLTALAGALLWSSPADAQGQTKLESIQLELWSEYDQPSMLVIYEFLVSQETPLPVEVTLRFPEEGNLIAVAVEKNGGLFNKDFTPPVAHGNWQTITISVDSYTPHRIEYYQPLSLEGNRRQFKYHWFGDYSVRQFNVAIVVPADSTALTTSPPLDSQADSPDGTLTTGMITKNDLRMGNSFQFSVEYERSSRALVRPDQTNQVVASTPVNQDTPGRVSIANLPWIIGGFGLALILIALFSYWRSTQSTESQPRRRRQTARAGEADQAYCHECGARAHAGDRFCRTCGSRLRVE